MSRHSTAQVQFLPPQTIESMAPAQSPQTPQAHSILVQSSNMLGHKRKLETQSESGPVPVPVPVPAPAPTVPIFTIPASALPVNIISPAVLTIISTATTSSVPPATSSTSPSVSAANPPVPIIFPHPIVPDTMYRNFFPAPFDSVTVTELKLYHVRNMRAVKLPDGECHGSWYIEALFTALQAGNTKFTVEDLEVARSRCNAMSIKLQIRDTKWTMWHQVQDWAFERAQRAS